nr:hypothetical protein [Tanacetum cinerariifolium]
MAENYEPIMLPDIEEIQAERKEKIQSIHQLAYSTVPDALDEYLQMGKPTLTDVERLYAFRENKHGLPGMLGSLDCTDWAWFGCPIAHKAQYCRHDHGPDPFILLEAVASNDLWIWHFFFVFLVTNLADDDHKRLRYNTMHKAARKDVERTLGRKEAISPQWYPEEEHKLDDLIRSDEQMYRIIRKFNRYSFFETPKVLLLAWDRVFKIKDAFGNKQYKPEDVQELFRELFNDVQNIHEELAEYINTPGWNRPSFYNNGDDDEEDCTIAVTPDFLITDYLIMGDEHLDTVPEKESDEFNKSSVEDLVPKPSEFEDECECDVPDCDDS